MAQYINHNTTAREGRTIQYPWLDNNPLTSFANLAEHARPLTAPAHTPAIRSARPETHRPAHSLTAFRALVVAAPHTVP